MRSTSNRPIPAPYCRCAGFTLIEVMVVTVIVAVLASIAYPSYQGAIRRAKRAEAQAALMQLMQQQERFYSQNNSYIAFSFLSESESETRFKWYLGQSAAKSAYEISGSACDGETIADCVVLTAKPGTENVDMNFTDLQCGDLTLRSTGEKAASTDSTDCWR
ncbi:type IV pilin protein [Noviherbaspirillum cavernae]|uniref:Type IV pilin protein n=1 Tax=Noviherbaspirillum cavernae TaxID=2320862 RepID=A0A418X2A2_9BURK|nr:type IV pilin protein [Noviherbaspirillum cavernae]RJG06597.1 type IV pilin protein [Noviherbaspirillum cavernae]